MSKTLAFRPRQDSLPPDEGSWHGDVKSFELRVLNGEAEVRDAVVLRHRAYAALGYELEDSSGECADRFDELSTTVLFGAHDHGRLVGAMRLCFSHPWHPISTLPCASHYPALKDVKREQSGGTRRNLAAIDRARYQQHVLSDDPLCVHGACGFHRCPGGQRVNDLDRGQARFGQVLSVYAWLRAHRYASALSAR